MAGSSGPFHQALTDFGSCGQPVAQSALLSCRFFVFATGFPG